MTSLPSLTLVIGAAASGKSVYGERLVQADGRPMTYLATAQAFDEEMRVKIATHRARRGAGWTTVEAPRDLVTPLATLDDTSVVLLDCVTLWLSTLILSDADLVTEESRLLHALAETTAPVVVITNEVGAGVVPEHALGRRFREAQGRLNQALAARADLVVAVIAGLPLALKGSLPEHLP